MSAALQLLVGLGNPGSEYAKHRHNAGQWFIEQLAKRQGLTLKTEKKFFASHASCSLAGQKTILAIPTTYMNESGRAVAALARFYKIPKEAVLIIHDELDLDPGIIRFKQGGGHGGHNGLRDITQTLGGNAFQRLRIGIGHPGNRSQVHNYVLSKPNQADAGLIYNAIRDGLMEIDDLVTGQFDAVMKRLHTTS